MFWLLLLLNKVKVKVKVCPIGYSSRRGIAEGNCPEPWFVVGWPVPFYRLGRYHNLGPLWNAQNAHNYAAHLALFAFWNPFSVALPPNSQDVTIRNHPPHTVGRSNRTAVTWSQEHTVSETPTTDRVRSGIELGPPRWKAARLSTALTGLLHR